MKKFFALFLFSLVVVVLLPALIVSLLGGGGESVRTPSAGNAKTIRVLADGEITQFPLEEYLFGVVAGEMPASFHIEALKAQAVAARTYILNKCANTDERHPDADVCTDSTHCKAYLNDEQLAEAFGGNWNADYGWKIKEAVDETKSLIAVYEGEPIEAVFHSTSSGRTESAVNVWGGDIAYLQSVDSPGDLASPKYSDDITVSKSEFTSIISEAAGEELGAYVGEAEYNDSGSVRQIDFGGHIFSGTQVRIIFELPSTNFTISNNAESFVFHTKGKGHGVGMSQYGADYFAENGMLYEDILRTYYKGIEITEYGANN